MIARVNARFTSIQDVVSNVTNARIAVIAWRRCERFRSGPHSWFNWLYPLPF
jgi:hypothetical protein